MHITIFPHFTRKKDRAATLVLILLLLSSLLPAQRKMGVSVHISLKVDTTKVRIYDHHVPDENKNIKTLVLKMRYGDSDILNPQDAKELQGGGCNILSVDVVYTDYLQKDEQDRLNRKRITELYFLCPDVFTQSMAQWKYVEQLGYKNEMEARKLLHGIVIKYIKIPPYKPVSPAAMFKDLKIKEPADSSFFKAFRKVIKHKEELICVDMTGSMSPYYFQVFAWLNMKSSRTPLNFSFFNDGDQTPDHEKRTGNVGGIYMFRTNSIDTVTKYAYDCITNGSGGDTPENNIESVIKGVKKYPETKEIVMLVDNWADMRDYSLLSEVNLPVRVIVCGTDLYGIKSPVNPQYLDLARKTGGSLHTMEEDLMDLAKKKDGDEVTIEGIKYVIRSGKFYKKV
jgi:hypothetical protein